MSIESTERVAITKDAVKFVVGKGKYDKQGVLNLMQELLLQILDQTTFKAREWIQRRVPKDTGRLREDVLFTLSLSKVDMDKLVLSIFLGSKLDYARYVNDYTTAQVRHTGEVGYNKYQGRHLLYDPEAVGHWFDELEKFVKQELQDNLAKAKIRISNMSNLTTRDLSRIG